MANETVFYILGGTLTVLALVISFVGIRGKDFPGSGRLLGGIIALFAAVVIGTGAFAVAGARDEQEHREQEAAEHAAEEQAAEGEHAGGAEAAPEGAEAGGQPAAPAGGPAATVQLAADPAALAFDKSSLSAKPGEVVIELDNPAAIPHNVAIEQGADILAESETVSQSTTSVSAELAPGSYTFLCTVPGHAEAGMEGTLSVK